MNIQEIAAEVAAILDAQTDLTEDQKDDLFIRCCEALGIGNSPEEDSAQN